MQARDCAMPQTTHWYPTSAKLGVPLHAYNCSEGAQPTLDYYTEAAAFLYYVLAYDRAKEIAIEKADYMLLSAQVVQGARGLAGCVQAAIDVYKLTGLAKYLTQAETCWSQSVRGPGGSSTPDASLVNPMGSFGWDQAGNVINKSFFASSWTEHGFPEFAEVDPNYCVNDVFGSSKCVPVSYTHLRAHETPEHLVCRLLLEK